MTTQTKGRIRHVALSVEDPWETAEFYKQAVGLQEVTELDGPLAEGEAGSVHGGDRLPWAPAEGIDNYDSLADITWQVHVYGTAKASLIDWCNARNIPLRVFKWAPEREVAGLARDAAYLLRPDTYVAVADPSGEAETLDLYFSRRGLA